jgi:hypothetical protein
VLEYNRLIKKFMPGKPFINIYNKLSNEYKPEVINKKIIKDLFNKSDLKQNPLSKLKKNNNYQANKKERKPLPKPEPKPKTISLPETKNSIDYFIKLRNNAKNSCFANVIIQALLSLGIPFFQKVII